MKHRNGFVSNSSSSSFIVCFPTKPENSDEVFDYLFTRNTKVVEYCDIEADTKEMSQQIFKDIQTSPEETDIDKLLSGYSGDYEDKAVRDMFNIMKQVNRGFDEYGSQADEIRKDAFKVFLDKNKDSYICKLNYSDNDGDMHIVMEHGDIFRNLPHVRFSRH